MPTALAALARTFWKDENGFIVSAELVLVGTIAVLSMVVGLTSVSRSINNELSDVADAFDSVNQSNSDTGSSRRGGTQSANSDDVGIVRR